MLQINGKTFMNLQEAVQWLLDNNALPFQSSANYVANTEIGLGTIVNPSPAKVRIGSLIFFADSKVSTVIGLTENGFICSDQYNNLVDDVPYVTNVSINASGHLITTLSDGQTIDAGIIKQVSNFSINASQHLIANYNDGTSTDLGAIFSGNVNIAGNLTADSIIENMSGYSYNSMADADINLEIIYVGAVKNGNKLTLVLSANLTKIVETSSKYLIEFYIPSVVGQKLFTTQVGSLNLLDVKEGFAYESSSQPTRFSLQLRKISNSTLRLGSNDIANLVVGTKYFMRYEATFLLSPSLPTA